MTALGDVDQFRVVLKDTSVELSRHGMVSLHADRQFRLIYVCNPKSGCTTILNLLFYCDRGFLYFQPEQIHSSYYAFWRLNRHNYSNDVVNLFNRCDAYVFSVTRHPLHRFVSGFVDKLLPTGQPSYFDARDFLCAYAGIDLAGDPIAAAVTYLEWLEKEELPHVLPSMSDPHFRRQVDNLGLGSNFPIDFIGKIEEPEPILDMFERTTGFRPTEIWKQRRRVTNHPAKQELLNSRKVRAAVERVYEPDFQAFSYPCVLGQTMYPCYIYPNKVVSEMLNIALNKPALQSSTSIWSSSPNPEVDARGANNGQISRQHGFHTGYESNPWWQVDLEDVFLIRKVILYNRRNYAERLRCFSIMKSLDGEKWQVMFRKRDKSVFGLTDDSPYVAEIAGDHLARYVRIRLDGVESLHFNECQVFGEPVDAELRQRLIDAAARAEQGLDLPPGRNGQLIELDGFTILVDHDNYAPEIIASLESGRYEDRERWLVKEMLEPNDRVIEAGTAVGVIAMTAASIIGAVNVLTFEANPEIVADAQRNFKRNGLGAIKSHLGVLKNRRSICSQNETVDFYIDKHFWASRLRASEQDERILKKVQVPVFCLEEEIEVHRANVLICDIEGGEVELLIKSDLTGVKKIIIETHYGWAGEQETDAMVRKLILDGFSIHLGLSAHHVSVFRR